MLKIYSTFVFYAWSNLMKYIIICLEITFSEATAMNILLFGISNVGKSVSGKLMADHQFISTGTLPERDAVRCRILNNLVCRDGNKVIAVTPLSYIRDIRYLFSSPEVISIELTDSAENIFERLVFSNENDVIYKDDDYKNRHRNHYLEEIQKDLDWYGSVYSDINYRFDISGMAPEQAVVRMIAEFHLSGDTSIPQTSPHFRSSYNHNTGTALLQAGYRF